MGSIEWRWEQDGGGGDNGTATFFPGTTEEITVLMCDFRSAYGLYVAITAHVKAKEAAACREVRMNLLNHLESELCRTN
jgi:hypothetical protein